MQSDPGLGVGIGAVERTFLGSSCVLHTEGDMSVSVSRSEICACPIVATSCEVWDANYFYWNRVCKAWESKFHVAYFRAKSSLKRIADYLSQEVDLTGKNKTFLDQKEEKEKKKTTGERGAVRVGEKHIC